MSRIGLLLFGSVSATVLIIVATCTFLTIRFSKAPEAKLFSAGHYPSSPPNGSYKGIYGGRIGKNWLGKEFVADKNEGINNFADSSPRFPFQTVKKTDLANKELEVLQLNYAYKNNPWWLRGIKDEIVETNHGHYQGKIYFKLGPIIVPLGYFQLEK